MTQTLQPIAPPATPPASLQASAEAALRASEMRYRRLFEAAQDGILLLNADTSQIEDVNPYLTDMLSYSHAELLGKRLWEVGAFSDVTRSSEMFTRLQERGFVRYSDLPLKTKAGVLVNVEFVSNSYDCAGVQVIQCNIRNLTGQRQAEEKVHKLSLVVEQSPVSIVIASPDGEIEYVNQALLDSSGYSRDELIGQPQRMLRAGAPDVPLPTRGGCDDAALDSSWKGELLSRRKDGSEYTEFGVVAPIRRTDGHIAHRVTITDDITQRKQDAEELDRHRHQLEQLVGERTLQLGVAMHKAEAANVAKSAFLANMSHEIRTPLGAITGMAYLIRRSQVTPRQADWLTKLETASRHLLELINAILDLSRIDAGKLVLDESPLEIERIANDVVSMLSDQAATSKLQLSTDVQPLPQRLMGDTARLQQALLNYAGNAVKFTKSGSVTLGISCIEDEAASALLRFEVRDTGIGIDAAILPRLFTAFEQADNSTTRSYGGTGLGLAIVHQLARMMGGNTGVTSTLGAGSCFWFTARLRKFVRLGRVPAAEPGSAEARLALEFPDARILLVDDEPINREVTQELLGAVIAQVDVADNGIEALRKAGRQHYDLILMDMQMPGMDGLEATRLIRALPDGATTRIVALTANAFSDDKARCLAAGMDGFVAKPFNIEVLFDAVVNALSRRL